LNMMRIDDLSVNLIIQIRNCRKRADPGYYRNAAQLPRTIAAST
jgi:hypothetical protein